MKLPSTAGNAKKPSNQSTSNIIAMVVSIDSMFSYLLIILGLIKSVGLYWPMPI